jgi:hypothetical protein
MALSINPAAYGTHCKACDALLNEKHHDPELCSTCLEVVSTLTGDLYHDDVEDEFMSTREVSLSVAEY